MFHSARLTKGLHALQGDIKWLQKDYQDLIVDRLAWVLDDRGAVLRSVDLLSGVYGCAEYCGVDHD